MEKGSLHIICGSCGDANSLKLVIQYEEDDNEILVCIKCSNCGTFNRIYNEDK